MTEKLSDSALQQLLPEVSDWSLAEGKLRREFKFKNFREAFAFMTQMAMISEKLDHHPEWSNVYNRVVVDLVTHDAGGISQKDLEWAKKANKTFGS